MAHQLLIVRRRALGFGSAQSIIETLSTLGISAQEWKTWREPQPLLQENTKVMRWGCTATVDTTGAHQSVLNSAAAIHRVNNKAQFAKTLAENGLSPTVYTSDTITSLTSCDPTQKLVVRPLVHSRGRHLLVTTAGSCINELSGLSAYQSGWYGRPLIEKQAEFRVYVLFGKVAAIASKHITDESQVAWNHSVGAEFRNVRWDSWNLNMCKRAMQAAELSKLDYAAVDVMVEEGTLTPWIIEINSAGSLPRNEDGSPSYRARCVAKSIGWHLEREDYTHFPINEDVFTNWREVIHPGVWRSRRENEREFEFTSVRSAQ